jgi:N-acetylneuraminic acid mutarotase
MMDMFMPRRFFILLLLLGAAVLLVVSATATSASSVQAVTADPPSSPIILPEAPPRYITDTAPSTISIELEPIDPADIFYQDNDTIIFATAGNSCGTAAELSFPPGGTGTGVNTSVSGLTQVPDDPVLSCMWGNPPDPRGYRTAWYRFTVPRNGQITISTFGSNYDTVLAVYQGTCDQLQTLACNDDHNMLTSKVTLNVRRDQVYYIEVADWQAGAPQPPNLEMSLVLDPIESEWQQITNIPLARTRHVGLTAGPYVYVIGGLSSFISDDNYQASNRVDRYHTPSGQWGQLANMPIGGGTRIGQFNSSGVHLDNRIYIPAGDDGGPTFAGQHWALDLNQNQWLELAAVNWAAWSDDGNPVGFAATAAGSNGYYLLGGTTDADGRMNSVGYTFFYNANTNSWTQRAAMNTSRYSHTAAWVGGRVCVAGGIHVDESDTLVLEPSGECYNPNNNSWSPIAPLNIARYGAGSAVGPNGKWYVFGGTSVSGGNFIAVPEVEVYDPATNRWSVLGAEADLEGTDSSPARTWPRGGFVGNYLWAAGGNMVVNNTESGALSLVDRLYVAPRRLYLPFMQGPPGNPALINNTFALAQFLPFHQPIFQNFATSLDFFDVFYFDLAEQRGVIIDLTNIPANHDYDLLLYNNNKSLLAESRNLAGQNEQIVLNLSPGRYYVVVERIFPVGPPDPNINYRLELR